MRLSREVFLYLLIIVVVIIRYAAEGGDGPRRPAPGLPSEPDTPVLVPEGEPLPGNDRGTVVVELDAEVKNGVGTAFAVDSNGTFITARHVVDGCGKVFLVRGSRTLEPVTSATSEQNRDFAVVRAARLKPDYVALSRRSPKRGEDGFMMGFPQGSPADVRATVVGATEMRSVGRYRMREPVIAWVERERKPAFAGSLGGISGGPVFDSEGFVVGTVVAGAPRRGRVYTTHPRVFGDTGFLNTERGDVQHALSGGVTRENFAEKGNRLRADRTIAQVYCKAD
ncbi:S1 family peptidase [Kordiimonas gwangyangensis]|uniref:S1 family peptidase n=1 Tax=Kordiimonas gwangyangensis TaxID=288022 RepID=UPI000363DB98|nr:serine protease [Kordiimonas gwangyangensis]